MQKRCYVRQDRSYEKIIRKTRGLNYNSTEVAQLLIIDKADIKNSAPL